MDRNIKNIIKEKIINHYLKKVEIERRIKKSIQQNNNVNNNIKMYNTFILGNNRGKNKTTSRQHKICLMTGKRSGVLKGFTFSRYLLKNFILTNKLTNVKNSNW